MSEQPWHSRRPRRWRRWLPGLVIVSIGLSGLFADEPADPRLTFFDIGQGDAMHFRSASVDILIDGGPSQRLAHLLAAEMPVTDRTIELLILTHPDYDHLAGFFSVLERFQVKRVLTSRAVSTSQTFRRWQRELAERKIPVDYAAAPQTYDLPEARLVVLWPTAEADAGKQPLNDHSVVIRFDTGGECVVLTGDASEWVERQLALDAIRCDVLKVGHHGSASSSSEEFLAAVRPEWAIISVGAKNRYGHPTSEALRRLVKYAGHILRTDEAGTIQVTFPPEGIHITTERKWD